MDRSIYSANISDFLVADAHFILGKLSQGHSFDLNQKQKSAWNKQIDILKEQLPSYATSQNKIFFEFSIPRMGKRADVILLIEGIIFVVEFKVGSDEYPQQDKHQAIDYALDLKNFHEGSHARILVPILVATKAEQTDIDVTCGKDKLLELICCNRSNLKTAIDKVISEYGNGEKANNTLKVTESWEDSPYKPTPTIIEAAQALYQKHKVSEISRSDAGAKNLSLTSRAINQLIENSKRHSKKTICFITGVPGSGKTLAGLNIATSRQHTHRDEHAVFLSGNGPLVDVLREALARDEYERTDILKGEARQKSKTFIQNIHHFRDEYLKSPKAPHEQVVIFDEAQRAWDRHNTSKFMRERGEENFNLSEPEFLIQVMDRHKEWCVIVALIGGGQEINTGEAGLSEWFSALRRTFNDWVVVYSNRLDENDYFKDTTLEEQTKGLRNNCDANLHLNTSVRSFRAERVSSFVGHIINNEPTRASSLLEEFSEQYPIRVTRDLNTARTWLKNRSRGSELFGLVASSGAYRLKAEGINVKAKINATDWFLNGVQDVRSCQYLEDVATEFDIQGLELDWVGICWDINFRHLYDENGQGLWSHFNFKGTKWQQVRTSEKQIYLENAYRVLLTRARQGMVIYVPLGDKDDPTRLPKYYQGIADYLFECGLAEI